MVLNFEEIRFFFVFLILLATNASTNLTCERDIRARGRRLSNSIKCF